MSMLAFTLRALRGTARILLVLLEGLFWLVLTVVRGTAVFRDAWRSRPAFVGPLRCPAGHEVPTEGGPFQCSACSYTYEGSILVCGHAECGATTPFVDCPVCGLSVRNPYRWGSP